MLSARAVVLFLFFRARRTRPIVNRQQPDPRRQSQHEDAGKNVPPDRADFSEVSDSGQRDPAGRQQAGEDRPQRIPRGCPRSDQDHAKRGRDQEERGAQRVQQVPERLRPARFIFLRAVKERLDVFGEEFVGRVIDAERCQERMIHQKRGIRFRPVVPEPFDKFFFFSDAVIFGGSGSRQERFRNRHSPFREPGDARFVREDVPDIIIHHRQQPAFRFPEGALLEEEEDGERDRQRAGDDRRAQRPPAKLRGRQSEAEQRDQRDVIGVRIPGKNPARRAQERQRGRGGRSDGFTAVPRRTTQGEPEEPQEKRAHQDKERKRKRFGEQDRIPVRLLRNEGEREEDQRGEDARARIFEERRRGPDEKHPADDTENQLE